MKRLWIAVALLCTVVGLCVVTEVYQHRQMERMLTSLDRLEEAYEQGDVTRARTLAEEMAQHYEKINHVMMCYIAHRDIDESLEAVMLLPELLQQNSREELAMEIAGLRDEFDHLRHIDDPLIWNIL